MNSDVRLSPVIYRDARNTKQKAQRAGSKYKSGQQKKTKKNHAWIGEQPTKEKPSTKTQIQCKSNGKKRKTENEHDQKGHPTGAIEKKVNARQTGNGRKNQTSVSRFGEKGSSGGAFCLGEKVKVQTANPKERNDG